MLDKEEETKGSISFDDKDNPTLHGLPWTVSKMLDKPGLEGDPFCIILNENLSINTNLTWDSGDWGLQVVSKPYRKWWQVMIQYLTLGILKAGWYYKVKLVK